MDNDMLVQYVANLSPGEGANMMPPIVNMPPARTGTPSPARVRVSSSGGLQSPLAVLGSAVGVGACLTRGGLSPQNLPGRATTPPG